MDGVLVTLEPERARAFQLGLVPAAGYLGPDLSILYFMPHIHAYLANIFFLLFFTFI